MRLDFSIPINRTRYSGLTFLVQQIKQRQVIGVGGRYDALLRSFRNQTDTGAVGISLALEKVVATYQSTFRRGMAASECEILISSVGENPAASLEDRMSMCRDVRRWGYRAEHSHPETLGTVEEVMRFARTQPNMLAVMFLKRSSGDIRLWLCGDKSSLELKRAEVHEFLLK